MNVIAPNLTLMVGELVGARLIAHAGSLLNLAKYPASTVQILGAEKALFRALKTKHDTPKYGHIYHASVVGQSSGKNKGKMSRVLAAKTSLVVGCFVISPTFFLNFASLSLSFFFEKTIYKAYIYLNQIYLGIFTRFILVIEDFIIFFPNIISNIYFSEVIVQVS